MEGERQEIHVAQVSLVDGYGKEIGIYDDDPGWWLNSKRNPENDSENGKVSPSNESTSSKSKLIKKKEEFNNNMITNQIPIISSAHCYKLEIKKTRQFINTIP